MRAAFDRRSTRTVNVGGVCIGGTHPVSIQSMTNTDTHDIDATYDQVMRLSEAGCDIVRITAPDLITSVFAIMRASAWRRATRML